MPNPAKNIFACSVERYTRSLIWRRACRRSGFLKYLREETDFTGSYYSVRRYVQKLDQRRSLPFRRLQQTPGQEGQVDFGSGAPVLTAEGRTKRTHVLRVALSHSRKANSEAVYHQTTEAFLSCLANTFREFDGVPKTLVIDDLRGREASGLV